MLVHLPLAGLVDDPDPPRQPAARDDECARHRGGHDEHEGDEIPVH
jgi:hypothetical protein